MSKNRTDFVLYGDKVRLKERYPVLGSKKRGCHSAPLFPLNRPQRKQLEREVSTVTNAVQFNFQIPSREIIRNVPQPNFEDMRASFLRLLRQGPEKPRPKSVTYKSSYEETKVEDPTTRPRSAPTDNKLDFSVKHAEKNTQVAQTVDQTQEKKPATLFRNNFDIQERYAKIVEIYGWRAQVHGDPFKLKWVSCFVSLKHSLRKSIIHPKYPYAFKCGVDPSENLGSPRLIFAANLLLPTDDLMKLPGIFLLTLQLLQPMSCSGKFPVKLSVPEETAIRTTIGNIPSEYRSKAGSYPTVPINEQNFFQVTETGGILINKIIDLESLCMEYQLCCTTDTCVIHSQFISSDSDPIVMNLEVTIEDIDDKHPQCGSNDNLVVRENDTSAEVSFSAVDEDFSSTHNRMSYTLRGNDSLSDYFFLPKPEKSTLQVRAALDYEQMQTVSGFVNVCNTAGKNCANCRLNIKVEDVDDNEPRFQKHSYTKRIFENHPLNLLVLKVIAEDPDEGSSQFYSMNEHPQFYIEPNGEIYLKKAFYMRSLVDVYRFKVMVTSRSGQAPTDQANVTIEVEDVNDNAPVLTRLGSVDSIEENKNISDQTVLFRFSVTDKDKGDNGKVECNLEKHLDQLSLQSIANIKGAFQVTVKSGADQSFDAEKMSALTIAIKCYDHGKPMKSVEAEHLIKIKDINEYPPKMAKTEFRSAVPEDAPIGYLVTKVSRLFYTQFDSRICIMISRIS
ncbi:hypothetical protein Ciccas_005747 [Cichlidogyrus casuarinus]|uniref:Cadherin domain-containing protein n=1 Tax=Cichlidogyrus casuarinus TaxID=1844966 RepID=A0ABD2Q816_9PLAT